MTNNNDTPSARPTFLVVDDDPMVRKLISRGLADLNPAAVLEVEDGLAAQQVLLEKNVDVVVTDVLMPNMDGLELMKWAQEHRPEPLWIVLSGLETFDAAVDALHLGAFDYLAKPPEVQRVRVAVRNALDQIELVRERKRLYEQIERSNAQLAEKVSQLVKLCRMLEEQAEIIQADLNRAEIIQHSLLPQRPPDIDGWCVETLYRSGSSVGGDFYDVVLPDNHHVGLVIADSAGHGVAAAMLSVLFKLRLKFLDNDGNVLMPNRVLKSLNRRLHETMTAPGTFITAAYVLLNRRTGNVRIASAGHPPCIWTSPAGESRLLERTGPALGLVADARYEEISVHLDIGDRLLMFTDGVLEGGPKSPTHDDLANALVSTTNRSDLLGKLYQAATQDIGGDRDDITMILIERGEGVSRFDDTPQPGERQQVQPSTAPVQLLEGVESKHAFLSIAGTATWIRSQAFFDAANKLLERCGNLTIDLGACEYLDSTFLGTLNEIVMSRPDVVHLQRLPRKIRALFEELSMDGVLSHTNLVNDPLPQEMEPLQRAEVDVARQGARILRAHEMLSSLSEENRELFLDVVESLRSDLDQSGKR